MRRSTWKRRERKRLLIINRSGLMLQLCGYGGDLSTFASCLWIADIVVMVYLYGKNVNGCPCRDEMKFKSSGKCTIEKDLSVKWCR